jgi:lysophospholipid acyltransferase (LPLAT)-like uncharacterized protein
VLKLVGSISIRGSSSHGGREALIEMVRFMRDGGEGVFTPDGPRGPIHSFAPGAAMAAARAGVPVILMRSAADRAWRFRSWDKLFVPKPFAKVRIAYSDLITVAKAANGSMDKGEPERLGAEMAALGRRIGADD